MRCRHDQGHQPAPAQPVDQLSCPYLLVMIDFDLLEPSGAGDPRRYLEELWA
jgi:hypothetical protein